ncbi:MAG: cold shock domain-containing protein [Desulfobacterales bacterium]|nr:cold shock domain-containing protein [Desulfobacterales bacterium]
MSGFIEQEGEKGVFFHHSTISESGSRHLLKATA